MRLLVCFVDKSLCLVSILIFGKAIVEMNKKIGQNDLHFLFDNFSIFLFLEYLDHFIDISITSCNFLKMKSYIFFKLEESGIINIEILCHVPNLIFLSLGIIDFNVSI